MFRRRIMEIGSLVEETIRGKAKRFLVALFFFFLSLHLDYNEAKKSAAVHFGRI